MHAVCLAPRLLRAAPGRQDHRSLAPCGRHVAGDLIVPGGEQPAAGEGEQEGRQVAAEEQPKGKKRKVAAAAAAADGPEPAAAKAPKKGKKGKQAAAAGDAAAAGKEGGAAAATAGGEEGGEAVAALKQQLAALQAENKQLKKQQRKEDKAAKRAAAAAKKKEERAARRAAEAAAAAEAAEAAAAAAPTADISAWKELQLHPAIEAAIARLGFEAPTHVQAECLPAAIRDRRDVIGAAQTGSGKTLAFGLPIMQLLLQERDQRGAAGAAGSQQAGGEAAGGREASPLRALILAPTRELAMQVCDHLQVGPAHAHAGPGGPGVLAVP